VRVLAFGTYDVQAHPRVQVLIDGLRRNGLPVVELVRPLGLSTAGRVETLRRPSRLPAFVLRVLSRWAALAAGSMRFRGSSRPSHVLVGYLGHFDVLLARLLFPRATIVLDHLIFAADTARDRGARGGLLLRVLEGLDRAALSAADVIVVDTPEHRGLVPASRQDDVVVVPVGATDAWFAAAGRAERPTGAAPSVVFFGLFTPLQGAPVIGEALRELHVRVPDVRVTLVGTGQDAGAVREAVADLPGVTWETWVPGTDLPDLVAAHDICLGIFGTTGKAARVVPNKVYQGAAAGCAVVTSDTEPQRRALDGAAVLVPAGNAVALADALTELASDRDRLAELRTAASRRARDRFSAEGVTADLVRRLR
jgi:glycosyltransferase involved in cell wall biosynthesis